MRESEKTFKAVAGPRAGIRVVSLTRTCMACPAQWDGLTDDDREVYVRYRYGHGEVCVGEQGDHSEFAAVRAPHACSFQRTDDKSGWDGELAERELFAVTSPYVVWPSMPDAKYPEEENA